MGPQDVYEVEGMLDASVLMQLAARPGFDELKYPDWPPQPQPGSGRPRGPLGPRSRSRTCCCFTPTKLRPGRATGEPGGRRPQRAGDQANALPHQRRFADRAALARAAEKGKQVTVLVELKARFDEAKNVQWARQLEDAGCYVIYGIAGYKTHAKALLIVRREAHRIAATSTSPPATTTTKPPGSTPTWA